MFNRITYVILEINQEISSFSLEFISCSFGTQFVYSELKCYKHIDQGNIPANVKMI